MKLGKMTVFKSVKKKKSAQKNYKPKIKRSRSRSRDYGKGDEVVKGKSKLKKQDSMDGPKKVKVKSKFCEHKTEWKVELLFKSLEKQRTDKN